ncbi:IPExxxVDY family protein [Brumimicrobium salinarum]|uniref:IPExxxVDY family protein n=1 Tax=Brumimicrobium salinarum TaxID=2058658 RepID=A0A2I0R4F9_9FLAO|nr:IPExxxVDY family protein [Brumimicrobium salinarum]PKR81471.1 IPExxxVDY family protein [Brumimicrobium salinarum]
MAKYTLSLEDDFNFDLIGICSHQGDYRVCWSINDSIGLKLKKSDEPFMVSGKKGQVISSHSLYEWEDEEAYVNYYLIQNKNSGKFLVPEKSQIDYFLVIKENNVIDINTLLNNIKDISSILTAFIFDPNELKSANKFIF